MKLSTQIILESNLYMSFEIKNGELYFELDEPEDKNLTFDFHQFPNETYPEGRCVKVHQSIGSGPVSLEPGTYKFSFNTKKYSTHCRI
jgi:hypothetical protein